MTTAQVDVVNITNIVVAVDDNNNTITTVTTATAHNLRVGKTVDIASIAEAALNGPRVVLSVATPTTFTFASVAGVAAGTYNAAANTTATLFSGRGTATVALVATSDSNVDYNTVAADASNDYADLIGKSYGFGQGVSLG